MSRVSPTFLDRLNARITEVDRAATAALSCADKLPATGPASLIPSHLHSLIALAHVGQMEPPAVMVGQGRDGSEALSALVGAEAQP